MTTTAPGRVKLVYIVNFILQLTNMTMFKSQQFIAIGGPTYDQQPPFQWSKSDFGPTTPHISHPDLWKFGPVMFDGSVDYQHFEQNRG